MRVMVRLVASAVGATLILTSPAFAASSCWTARSVAAAKVRDFETMLMVASLRCNRSDYDFLESYNDFVRGARAPLIETNEELRNHFTQTLSGRAALDAYDRFVTGIANRYGAGADGLSCSDMASITRAAQSASGAFEDLAELATNAGVMPVLDAPRCASIRAPYEAYEDETAEIDAETMAAPAPIETALADNIARLDERSALADEGEQSVALPPVQAVSPAPDAAPAIEPGIEPGIQPSIEPSIEPTRQPVPTPASVTLI